MYCTTTDVSNELNGLSITASTTPSTSTVEGWIQESDSMIDHETGRVWSSTAFSSVALDYDGNGTLRLPYYPLISISEVLVETQGLGASSTAYTTLTEGRTNDFIVYLDEGEIKFFGTDYPTEGYQKVIVSGSYGYTTTPYYIKRLSTLLTAKRVIQAVQNSTARQEGGSVTVGNISITDPSTFGISYVRSINDEIMNLFKSINKNRFFRTTRRYDDFSY